MVSFSNVWERKFSACIWHGVELENISVSKKRNHFQIPQLPVGCKCDCIIGGQFRAPETSLCIPAIWYHEGLKGGGLNWVPIVLKTWASITPVIRKNLVKSESNQVWFDLGTDFCAKNLCLKKMQSEMVLKHYAPPPWIVFSFWHREIKSESS